MIKDLATFLIFRCVACRGETDARAFPLCTACIGALVDCPPLCPSCASPACPPFSCSRPWISNPNIRSFSGRYLGLEPAYRVLKTWKKNRGFLFDRLVLTRPPLIPADCQLVPIPQRVPRAWSLGGSPAESLACWIARHSGAGILRPLGAVEHEFRQGELGLDGRLRNELRFEIRHGELRRVSGNKILLIDDFVTSGHTVRAAARALRLVEPGFEIHVYCLCLRPLRQGVGAFAERRLPRELQGDRGAVAVGQESEVGNR